METNSTETHTHTDLMVCGGVVRCGECLEFLPEHPDSRPVPGLVESNQFR